MPPLILASQSPRRKELLALAGIEFSIRSAGIPEIRRPNESPRDYVLRLSLEKAAAVAEAGEFVLGADTIVVQAADVLEKPRDNAEAKAMLHRLSGVEHKVLTGVCLLHPAGALSEHESTTVRFAKLTEQEVDNYVASGEPMDKAGAYAIQGLASKFVERIDGCYFNVMGLPLALVYRLLKSITPLP